MGAGTSPNSSASIGADNNSRPTQATIAANVSTAALNQLIPTQANQLDQYGSYTYSLGWYLLSPAQFNDMMRSGKPNVSGWQLLMQYRGYAGTRALPSDGLPVYGRVGTEPFYVAVPMSGIAEAAAAGRTMADLIVDGHCPTLPVAFSPNRLKDLPPPAGTGGH